MVDGVTLFSCFLMMRVSEGEIMWKTGPRTGTRSCYKESIKALEADVQHANALAAALPADAGGDFVQMEVSYSMFAPLLVHLVEWLDCSCTDSLPSYLGLLQILVYKVYVDGMRTMSSQDRRASLKEFYCMQLFCKTLRELEKFSSVLYQNYITEFHMLFPAAVMYPSLILLQDDFQTINGRQTVEEYKTEELAAVQLPLPVPGSDTEREEECTICMDGSNEIVLPKCGHSMCSSCFHDWNCRSQTCPFCRGSLESIESGDLWVLTSFIDIMDTVTLAKQNLRRFYRYIQNLPLVMPDNHLFIYDYLI